MNKKCSDRVKIKLVRFHLLSVPRCQHPLQTKVTKLRPDKMWQYSVSENQTKINSKSSKTSKMSSRKFSFKRMRSGRGPLEERLPVFPLHPPNSEKMDSTFAPVSLHIFYVMLWLFKWLLWLKIFKIIILLTSLTYSIIS